MLIYRLYHVRSDSEYDDEESFHLGSYSTRENAEEAIELLRTKPGFRDYPDDFIIDEELVDQVHWPDGFVRDRLDDLVEEVNRRKKSAARKKRKR
jgi:hypothetical protein